MSFIFLFMHAGKCFVQFGIIIIKKPGDHTGISLHTDGFYIKHFAIDHQFMVLFKPLDLVCRYADCLQFILFHFFHHRDTNQDTTTQCKALTGT